MKCFKSSSNIRQVNNSNENLKSRCSWTQIFAAVSIASLSVSFSRDSAPGNILQVAGKVVGGFLIDKLGRKNTISATAMINIVGRLLIIYFDNIWMVNTGHILADFCAGVAFVSLSIYLCETIQTELRGTLTLLPLAFINIGGLLSLFAGQYISWSLALLGGAIYLVSMFFMPETPRWFISKEKHEPARKALQWLRGKETNVEPEMNDIIESHVNADKSIFQLLKYNLKPLLISLGLMFFQQNSGINFIMFYAQDIFNYVDFMHARWLIIGGVNFFAIFITMILIDQLGRKPLLYTSSVGMIITLGLLGGFFLIKRSGQDVSHIDWFAPSILLCYTFCYVLGFGTISNLIMAEILPTKIRGSGSSIVIGFYSACSFPLSSVTIHILIQWDFDDCCWYFAVICAMGLVFLILCVPETKGKSLEDIEVEVMGRVRRMGSVENNQPLSSNTCF